MKKNVSKKNGILNIDISFNGDEWKKAVNKSKEELLKNVTVKGFRKGQAPKDIALKQIEPTSIYKNALDTKLDEVYKDAALDLTSSNIISKPEVSYTKASESEGNIRISAVLFPEIKLPKIEELKTKREKVNVTQKDIDEEVNNFKKQLRKTKDVTSKDEKTKLGDTVTIDFVGKIDGEAFSGGTANDHDLELGSKSFIDNFEEQLVGKKIGDKVNVNVTFPEDYQVDEFKSKPALFEVKINGIKRHDDLKGKELDERLKMYGFDSLENLKLEAGKLIEKDRNKRANESFRSLIIQEILDNESTEVPVPDSLIKQESVSMWADLEKEVEKNKQTMKNVLKEIKKTKNEYIEEHIVPEAKRRLQDSLIISEVSKIAKIEVSDDELNKIMEKEAKDAKIPLEQFKEIVNPETVRINTIHDKVLDYLANTK